MEGNVFRSFIPAIPVVCFLTACGSTVSDGNAKSKEPIALSRACEEYRETICQRTIDCRGFGANALEVCKEEYDCNTFPVQELVEAGKINYDGVALRRCLQKLVSVPCVDDEEGSQGWELFFQVDEDCRAAFRGLVAVGDECETSMDCASGWCRDECPGHCAATGEVGSACSEAAPCAPHLGCVAGVCGPLPVADQPCALESYAEISTGLCAPGLLCDDSLTCRDYPRAGEACARRNWGYPVCEGRSFCNEAGTCIARGELGDACEFSDGCRSEFWCVSGTCATRIPEGGDCSAHEGCDVGLRCLSTGVCGKPLAAGSPCDEETDDCYDFCDGGRCVMGVGPGAVCDETTYCWAGPCVDGVCMNEWCTEPEPT